MTRVLGSVLAVLVLSACWGTVGVVGEFDDGYPPVGYIATATPVYYQGYPSYWYGGRWYRREGSGWRGYREEPAYLRDYRAHSAAPVRQSYGRGQYYGHAHGGGTRHR